MNLSRFGMIVVISTWCNSKTITKTWMSAVIINHCINLIDINLFFIDEWDILTRRTEMEDGVVLLLKDGFLGDIYQSIPT